jgi:hypothetical protein
MARSLFVLAWVDWQENEKKRQFGAVELFDVAPKNTPISFFYEACKLAGQIEQINGMSLIALINQAALADVGRPFQSVLTESYYKEFGHYLVMGALGHGASWFDDHEKFKLELPYICLDYNSVKSNWK